MNYTGWFGYSLAPNSEHCDTAMALPHLSANDDFPPPRKHKPMCANMEVIADLVLHTLL